LLSKEDLIKILQAAAEEKGLADTTEGLMARTSLGNQKVGPMKGLGGLVSGNYLSPEGKLFSKTT